jgi:hypothetical protein
MALTIINKTRQQIPLVIGTVDGGYEVRLAPRQSVVVPIEEPTPQMLSLKGKGKIVIRK